MIVPVVGHRPLQGRGTKCFFCVLNVFERLGWGGVGHVNVPCTLHTCWMLRNGRVGVGWGMLTFLARCTLQLLTIYMILRMLVMMLKMMMLWWWWWCDDDDDDGDDDDVMMIMMMMFIMMMTVQTKQVVFWNDDDAFSHAGCAKSLFRYSGCLFFIHIMDIFTTAAKWS